MTIETITERDDLVIWKMTLRPGESSHWHTDACHRFSVIVSGDKLGIEFQDNSELIEVPVEPGLTGWDAPEPKVHRAVNLGNTDYVEVVSFYRDNSGVIPQPRFEP